MAEHHQLMLATSQLLSRAAYGLSLSEEAFDEFVEVELNDYRDGMEAQERELLA